MTQETPKERSYRKTLENTRDSLDGFEEQYANKEVYSAFDKLTGIVEKGLNQASKIPVSTDKLSVEKLQEQLNSKDKSLTQIRANIEEHNQIYDLDANTALLLEGIDGIALAAIGGDDE